MPLLLDRPPISALLAPPILDDISRRGLLTGLGAAAALTACGTAAAPTPAAPATRTVDSRFGPVDLPIDPRRVVTTALPDWALVLGLPLVGAEGEFADAANPFAAYQTGAHPELATAARVTTAPLDLEGIAALTPDLILGASDESYGPLSAIAPTFGYTETATVDGVADVPVWRAALREIGAAAGREQQAEDVIGAYEQRAADLRERLAARLSGARMATVNPTTDALGVFGRGNGFVPTGVLADDLGLTLAPITGAEYLALSLEELGRIDADVLFVAVGSVPGTVDRDRTQLAPYATSALWPRIPAVAAGQVHEFDRSLVYASPLTASVFLDVVEAALLPGGAS